MIEGKGLGNKKVNRVNLSLTNLEYKNLRMLAVACDMRPTELAGHILRVCMNDSRFIHDLQQQFGKERAYRIRLVQGEYLANGREDLE